MGSGMLNQGIARAGLAGQTMAASQPSPSEIEQVMSVLRDAIQSCSERAQELELKIDRILSPEEPTPASTADKGQMPVGCQHALELLHASEEVAAIARRLGRVRQRVML